MPKHAVILRLPASYHWTCGELEASSSTSDSEYDVAFKLLPLADTGTQARAAIGY